MYITTASRITSGLVRRYREGLRLVMLGAAAATLPCSIRVALTVSRLALSQEQHLEARRQTAVKPYRDGLL